MMMGIDIAGLLVGVVVDNCMIVVFVEMLVAVDMNILRSRN